MANLQILFLIDNREKNDIGQVSGRLLKKSVQLDEFKAGKEVVQLLNKISFVFRICYFQNIRYVFRINSIWKEWTFVKKGIITRVPSIIRGSHRYHGLLKEHGYWVSVLTILGTIYFVANHLSWSEVSKSGKLQSYFV